jgi:hypothetical protein
MMRKYFTIALFLILIGSLTSVFASYARVESMGKNSTFIMDDISIFDNPANINIFPNHLIGEFGAYTGNPPTGVNQDPQSPWFGGIFSLPYGPEGTQDPRVSIAGAFNRKDDLLFKLIPNRIMYINENNILDTVPVPETVTNFDGFLGGTTPSGNMYGVHIYTAIQDGAYKNETGDYIVDKRAFSSVVKADAGINWEFDETSDIEISAGIARIRYGMESQDFFDPNNFSLFAMGRVFSTIDAINGELVPVGKYHLIKVPGKEEMQISGGMGVNVALDRGFFWLGLELIKTQSMNHDMAKDKTTGLITYNDHRGTHYKNTIDETGGKISFGIERNIFWDWFVVRVGGQKVVNYIECKPNDNTTPSYRLCEEGNYLYTNDGGNGQLDDHIGFGFGINVEQKLKVDATVAEDVLFRNPFQGSGRILSRISATYSF